MFHGHSHHVLDVKAYFNYDADRLCMNTSAMMIALAMMITLVILISLAKVVLNKINPAKTALAMTITSAMLISLAKMDLIKVNLPKIDPVLKNHHGYKAKSNGRIQL